MNKPKSLKDKKYPTFIRDNSVIKKCGKITKSFEEIGLPDYSDVYAHECDITIEKFVSTLKTCLTQFPKTWARYDYRAFTSSTSALRVGLDKLVNKITTSSIKKAGKLVIPCEIQIPSYYRGKTLTYEKGSSLITLLNGLCQDLEDMVYLTKVMKPYIDLINRAVDLELSWNKKLKVVFSTHPWDIATMSMRGISSCQAWGKRQSPCLIGSIVDPNMGIVFLTDDVNHKKYGSRMIARSVVRLTMPNKKLNTRGSYISVSSEENKKRSLYLEHAYSYWDSGPTHSEVPLNVFSKLLNEKAKVDGVHNERLLTGDKATKYFHGIPLTPQVKKTPDKYRSYRDSGLMYVPLIS